MKTFVVITAAEVIREDGSIVRHSGTERTVEADYYRVQDGALTFRTEKRGNEQYNPAVRVFAPGFWAEVYEKLTLAARVEEFKARQPGMREIDLPPAVEWLRG
jgi:hypothetical protein